MVSFLVAFRLHTPPPAGTYHGKDGDDITLLAPELFAIRALEGLTAVGEEAEILRDVQRAMREEEREDSVVKAVEELRKGKSKSVRAAEWRESDGLLQFRGKIYVPPDPDLHRRVVSLHHDMKIAGHPERWKTLELVSRNYWWPQMSRYISQYSGACDLCLRMKAQRQQPMGELQPLPVPEARWYTVSVDFIVELPEAHGFDAVMNVVDSVSKRAHFVPTNTTTTALSAA